MQTQRLTILVPKQLHRELKIAAAEQGSTMTEMLLDCARKIVAARTAPPAPLPTPHQE